MTEVVLQGTIRLYSKICSQNVHFHDHFSGPVTLMRAALIQDLFSYGFPRKLHVGPYGSYDNDSSFIYTLVHVHYKKEAE